MRMDVAIHKNKGISEKRKHTKYQLVVRPLHSSQKWSWTEDLGMGEKANLEVIGARLEEQDCLLVIVSRTLNTACRDGN